jgi:hypothetical protein
MKMGHQIQIELYKIILETLKTQYSDDGLSDSMKVYFISKLQSLDQESLTEKVIEIVTELCKRGGVNSNPSDHIIQGAKFLWSLAVRDKECSAALAIQARKKFQEQVQYWADSSKEEYIALCIDNISSRKMSLQSLKMGFKLMEKLTQRIYNKDQNYREDFVRELVQSQDLVQIIIEDLKDYISFANELVRTKTVTEQQLKVMEHQGKHLFTHSKNIKSRLKRMARILQFAKVPLTITQIEEVWDVLVSKSVLKDQD